MTAPHTPQSPDLEDTPMTDIAVRDDNPTDITAADTQPRPQPLEMAGSALLLWAQEAHQANQIAKSLAQTSFVPASLRGKPADITAAILAGQEMGLRPMASLRSIDVIQGTPALRAHAMRGLVQSHGHSIQLVESTDRLCRMRGRRRGEQEWQEAVWTIEDAQRLGLLSKDQWKKQPKNMLVARCTGVICRLVASDVLHAVPYASEEIDGPMGEGGEPAPTVTQVTAAEILGNGGGNGRQREPERSTADPVTAEDLDWPEPAQPGGDR